MTGRRLFITANHTNVGKTVVSAILVKALRADYWKPVQSGEPKDRDIVRALVADDTLVLHEESYCFSSPISPHEAARRAGTSLRLSEITPPKTENTLVIEGAGGVLSPLNEKETITDLIGHLQSEVVLVIGHYLGSINHSLLTIEALERRGIPLRGIVFCGECDAPSEECILDQTKLPVLFRVPRGNISPEMIGALASNVEILNL